MVAQIPMLAISGGWSRVFNAICQVVALLTKGRFTTVRSTNHFPQSQNPLVFDKLMREFMREADSR